MESASQQALTAHVAILIEEQSHNSRYPLKTDRILPLGSKEKEGKKTRESQLFHYNLLRKQSALTTGRAEVAAGCAQLIRAAGRHGLYRPGHTE